MAAGEIVGDKIPGVPARSRAPVLAGRMVSGAVCGAALNARHGPRGIRRGTFAGAIGAAIGANTAVAARRSLKNTWASALLEDAFAIALASWVVRRARR